MSDWRIQSTISGDVVFFPYISEGTERTVEEVFVWDLDKTYLDTSVDSLSSLFSTIVERSWNKKNVPGTKILIQVLSKSWKELKGQNRFPVYFITASPPQMESRISEKFSLDGIFPFGCFYKDNLRNIHPKRFWRLTRQVGYKIQALLQLRKRLKENVKQILWGDDSESDAIIYNLYSDICSRRRGAQDLRNLLKHLSVPSEQIDCILQLQSEVPENDPVEKIYINLAVDTDPEYYLKFGRRTVPTYNTFQVALDLNQDQRLGAEEVYIVAQDMIFNYGFSPEELNRSFDELIRRRVLGETTVGKLIPFLVQKGLFHPSYKSSYLAAKETSVQEGRVYQLEGQFEPWVASHIDYLHDYR